MALMLRKLCQPVLNDVDLDAFHADICDDTKYLSIYTPCGKPFATVHGVRFASTRPSNDELPYAVELLGDWLVRNRLVIADYIQAFETHERLKATTDSAPLSKGYAFSTRVKSEHRPNSYTGSYGYFTVITGYVIESKDERFTFDVNHGLQSWEGLAYGDKIYSRNVGVKLPLPADIIRTAKSHFKDLVLLENARDKMEAIHGEMNVCKD